MPPRPPHASPRRPNGVFGFLLLTLTLATLLPAADLYVSTAPGASDLNPGTAAAPFATVNRAAALAQAGDTVWIGPGTYQPTAIIQPARSGTSAAPITYRAQTPGTAIIDGRTTLPAISTRKGLFYISGRSWVVVDDLRLINSGFFGFLIDGGSSDITIRNCSTFFTNASGICGAGASRLTVLNNVVQQACISPNSTDQVSECITMASVNTFEVAYNTVFDRLTNVANGGEGIDAKNACLDGTIHHNLVYDLARVGIYVDAFSKPLSNVSVYANTVFNTGGGITVASEQGGAIDNVSIHDNLVLDVRRGPGIRLAGYLNNGPLNNVYVYNNTVVRSGRTDPNAWENCGLLVEADNPANTNFVVRNNIFSQNTRQIRTKGQTYLTLDRNLLDGPLQGGVAGTNALLAAPLFMDAAANDFRLAAASPAIDAALGTPLSTRDLDDVARPVAGPAATLALVDLGAFEWTPPPTPRQLWQNLHFAPAQLATPALEATVWGDQADPDADGLPNLLEYALGGAPLQSDRGILPVISLTPSLPQSLQLTFPRTADPALLYEVQASSDLAVWTEVWSSTGAANVTGPVTVPDPVSLSAGKRFLRLRVSRP